MIRMDQNIINNSWISIHLFIFMIFGRIFSRFSWTQGISKTFCLPLNTWRDRHCEMKSIKEVYRLRAAKWFKRQKSRYFNDYGNVWTTHWAFCIRTYCFYCVLSVQKVFINARCRVMMCESLAFVYCLFGVSIKNSIIFQMNAEQSTSNQILVVLRILS